MELSDDVVALAADVLQCLAPHAMMLPREGWEGQRHNQTPAALLIARYVELGGSEALYLDRSETPNMPHWMAHHLVAPDMRLTVDPVGRPVVLGAPPQWPHTWDMAVRTMRMAPRGQRAGWPGAERQLAEARAAQVQQPAGNTKDCGVCALMSAVGTLLRVPRPGNLLSALDRRLVAAVVLNRDMGPIARLPSLGELPAAVLDALPAPRTPLDLADVPHSVGLPGACMQHALLCMAAAADGGMSMLMTVSLQHVQDAMQQQRMHAPQPWEKSAKRWLRMESVPSTHTVGVADMGRLVVLEGEEYWACVRVETGGLEWVVVTACRLRSSSPGARPATGGSGSASGSWGRCAGHTGARLRTSRRRRRSPWRSRDRRRSRGRTSGPWPRATCGRLSMQLSCAGRCRVTQRPSPGPRQRSPPATGQHPRWHCCIACRGCDAGLWRHWSPTPGRCACTIAERARCSRSAPPTWRPCTLVH